MTELSDPTHSRSVAAGMTRDCIDPWQYFGVRPNGEVGPCCVRVCGDLRTQTVEQIMNGEKARQLRADLLSGRPDATCRACGLRGEIATAEFLEKVEALLDAMRVPAAFDPDLYLDANPGLRKAGVDAREHFVRHGRLEGRRLHPEF